MPCPVGPGGEDFFWFLILSHWYFSATCNVSYLVAFVLLPEGPNAISSEKWLASLWFSFIPSCYCLVILKLLTAVIFLELKDLWIIKYYD